MAGLFVTGTDTGIGKTWATVALMRFLQAEGLTVIGMKPVASGCVSQDGEWRNEDALLLQKNASLQIDYAKLNVYAFAPPIAPHLAARQAGQAIHLDAIVRQCRELERLADGVLVEGVGGWEVPLNADERVSHLAKALNLPVVLVVGMRLGCLSHALLTHDAMLRSRVDCLGWVANCLEPDFPCLEENIAALCADLTFPCLGVIPHGGGLARERFRQGPRNVRFFGFGREEILRRLG
ncbi:MAG: dethiobiotin synthase [Candidatus Methylumidiphilus sp.]